MDDPFGHPVSSCPKAKAADVDTIANNAAALSGAPAGSPAALAAAAAAREAALRALEAPDGFTAALDRVRGEVLDSGDDDVDSGDDRPAPSVASMASLSSTSSAVRRLNILEIQPPLRQRPHPYALNTQALTRKERRAARFGTEREAGREAQGRALGEALLSLLQGASSSSAPAPTAPAPAPPPQAISARALAIQQAREAARKAAEKELQRAHRRGQ